MEIQQIRAFLAVAEELHFGRAAERLHMAQPPVSRSIQQLERELGTSLFERTTRSVRLTSAGEALIGPARDALDALERGRVAVSAAGAGEIGRVRVSYAGVSTNVHIGRLSRAVRQTHPGVQLELLSQQFAQPLMAKLLRREIDIAIGRWSFLPAGVVTRVLQLEELVVAVPETHRLADRDEAAMADFEGEPFVSLALETGSTLVDRLRTLTQNAGFAADVVQYAPDTWTAMALVSAGVGCSLTLSSVADNVADPHLRFIRLTDPMPPVEMLMAWRSSTENRAVDAVLALSERVLPTPGSMPEMHRSAADSVLE